MPQNSFSGGITPSPPADAVELYHIFFLDKLLLPPRRSSKLYALLYHPRLSVQPRDSIRRTFIDRMTYSTGRSCRGKASGTVPCLRIVLTIPRQGVSLQLFLLAGRYSFFARRGVAWPWLLGMLGQRRPFLPEYDRLLPRFQVSPGACHP